jgi:hypothetical protein
LPRFNFHFTPLYLTLIHFFALYPSLPCFIARCLPYRAFHRFMLFYPAFSPLPRFTPLSPLYRALPRFLPFTALYPAFSRFSSLYLLTLALSCFNSRFITLLLPLYCALIPASPCCQTPYLAFTPTLPHFNSHYPTLLRFHSRFTNLHSHYPASPKLSRFNSRFTPFQLPLPRFNALSLSLYPASTPINPFRLAFPHFNSRFTPPQLPLPRFAQIIAL